MPAPILAVAGFLDRLAELDEVKGTRRKNEKGPGARARELLAERGLSADVLRQGRQLVERAQVGPAGMAQSRETRCPQPVLRRAPSEARLPAFAQCLRRRRGRERLRQPQVQGFELHATIDAPLVRGIKGQPPGGQHAPKGRFSPFRLALLAPLLTAFLPPWLGE